MSVLGFKEAFESSIDVSLPSGRQVAVVSLPMLAVLKVLAWSERRVVEPCKDASGLLLILQHYLDAGNSERIYSEAGQMLESPDFDYERVGAWLAGKDALETIRNHSLKANRIESAVRSVLAPEMDPAGPLHLIGGLGTPDSEQSRQTPSAFLSGFSGYQRLL